MLNLSKVKDKLDSFGAKSIFPVSVLVMFAIGLFIGYIFSILIQMIIIIIVAGIYSYTRNFKGFGVLMLFAIVASGAGLVLGNILDLII